MTCTYLIYHYWNIIFENVAFLSVAIIFQLQLGVQDETLSLRGFQEYSLNIELCWTSGKNAGDHPTKNLKIMIILTSSYLH